MKVDGQTVFNSTTLMLQAALDGMGFAYVPFDVVQPHIDAGRLVPARRLVAEVSRLPPVPRQQRQIAPALALVIEALRVRSPGLTTAAVPREAQRQAALRGDDAAAG